MHTQLKQTPFYGLIASITNKKKQRYKSGKITSINGLRTRKKRQQKSTKESLKNYCKKKYSE